MKFFIGTVPYGRDNVGDEAILATIINSIRKNFPDADITASTDEQKSTAEKFNIKTAPLFGHKIANQGSQEELEQIMKNTDVYIWGGATGLSDYPEQALKIADTALKFNKKLVLFSCGMNEKLNPAFYKLHPGKRMTLLNLFKCMTLGIRDFVKEYEDKLVQNTKEHIKDSLNQADLIMVRDEQTKIHLEKCGVSQKIYPTSDPAVLLEPSDKNRLEEIWQKQKLWTDDRSIVGICISAQREVQQMDDIVKLADYFVKKHSANILFIPMNHKTDAKLMQNIQKQMQYKKNAKVLTGFFEPEDITAVAGKMDLIISSRLHLLILASISNIPIVGLSRGSKIDNFLKKYREKTPGSVENFNLQQMKEICDRLLANKETFQEKGKKVFENLHKMAETNCELLKKVINGEK